jgi:hypothetical protein
MANNLCRGRAAVAIAMAIGVGGLLDFPGCGVAVAQDIIAEGTRDGLALEHHPVSLGQ